ncbi:glycosyltransferase [Nocardioides sp.]|uniref:glycosyltransferase n=1 Tax=Nocardioides sp. TaxID=35761 RepID=UPI0039E32524
MSEPFTLFVTYGTDHHRFGRLGSWLEDWLADHPEVTCLAQEGYSTPPAGSIPVGIVSREELLDMMRTSWAVVGQGGPGTVLDAAVVGKLPIVVPRLARYDEVVDDHQVAFCRRMAADGRALLAESPEALRGCLDAALADPSTVVSRTQVGPIDETVANVESLLRDLTTQRPGFVSLPRLGSLIRPLHRRTAAAYH